MLANLKDMHGLFPHRLEYINLLLNTCLHMKQCSAQMTDWVRCRAHRYVQLSACMLRRSFVKVGAMVFLCHDVNDIFMEGAKMARYAEHKWLPTALFAVFMLSWFASRIYYFPAYVIRSVYHEPIEV